MHDGPRLLARAHEARLAVLQRVPRQRRHLDRQAAVLGVVSVDDGGHPDEDACAVAQLLASLDDGCPFCVSVLFFLKRR